MEKVSITLSYFVKITSFVRIILHMAHMVNGDLLGHLNQSPRACHAAHEYEEDVTGSLSEMEALWTRYDLSQKFRQNH